MSSKPDSGIGLLQPQFGISLQLESGRSPSVASGFNSGMAKPGILQPSQPPSSYTSSSSGGMGWSSGIAGQHQQVSATPPPSMGWSSGLIGQHLQQASATPPSSMGWSAGMAGQNPSYSSGLGSSDMNSLGSVSVGSAAPPTAASLMMGVSQPLIPQQQQPSQMNFLQPTPGPNPFANSNSLI